MILYSTLASGNGDFVLGPSAVIDVSGGGEHGPDGRVSIAPGGTLTIAPGGTFTGDNFVIGADTAIGGTLSPYGRDTVGTLHLGGHLQFNDPATYEVDVAELADRPELPSNDAIRVAGNAWLGGTLTLQALSKLHPRVPHPDPPHPEVEWYGDQTRIIVSTEGENQVGSVFAMVPQPQPENWNNIMTGTPEWSQGHIGRGVFLTRQNEGGANDVPGISYASHATKLHLFQACDGDTNGDRWLGGRDIQNIVAYALFGMTEDPGPGFVWPPDWPHGDFTGDGLCGGLDLQAILATGLWNAPMPYDVVKSGDSAGGEVDLILDPSTGNLTLRTGDVRINGYVIASQAGVLSGEPTENLGWFVEDRQHRISGNMGFSLVGEHDLGHVIGPEWLAAGTDFFDDLTFSYTVEGTPGVFVGSLVVPEPGTLAMLIAGVLSLLWLWGRRRPA